MVRVQIAEHQLQVHPRALAAREEASLKIQSPPQARADLSGQDLDLERACSGFVNCELSRKPRAPLVIRLQKPPSVVKLQADDKGYFALFAGRRSMISGMML